MGGSGERLVEGAGDSRARLVVLMTVVVAVLTALISVNGAFAGAIVLTGVLTVDGAYRGIAWTTVILVAGMIPLSTAMVQTGAAEQLAEGLIDVVGDSGPRVLLLGLVLLTFALDQLISNMATALIVIPSVSRLRSSWTCRRSRS